MAKPNKEEKRGSKWIQLIKEGKIKEVRLEVESEVLGGKNELECIVAISQLAYSDVRKGIQFDSSPSDVLCLTDSLCSVINIQPTKNALRFFTSLYHILQFFYNKDHLEHVISLFKTVVQFKKREPWAYEDEGKTLHDPFIRILKNTLGKVVSTGDIMTTGGDLLWILLELSVNNQGLNNGELLYLQILLNVCQVADKDNNKAAVRLITNGLGLFYKVEKIRDSESCLPALFKLYTCLYIFEIRLRNHRIALGLVDLHLNDIKWKFKDNTLLGECFVLLCNAVKVLSWNSQEPSSLQKKVEGNISILKSFQISTKKNPVVIAASSFMVSLLVNSLKAHKENNQALPEMCLEPIFLMIFSLYNLLKDNDADKPELIQCLSNIFVIVSGADPPYGVDLLKRCVGIITEAQEQMLEHLRNLRSTGHKKAEIFTNLLLFYSANTIRTYHLVGLSEEVILIAQPICKWICSLPSTVVVEPQNQQTTDVCFTCLVSAFGKIYLEKGLKAIVAWVSKCPQSSGRAFRLWGDLKHNTMCEGSNEHLNKTVWTILSEERASLESEWFQCELTNAQIADLLILELKTYFVNKSLRGQPAMEAGEALLALPGVDCIPLVRGLTIALDIASASPDHHDHCVTYYNKSKSLITKLRNRKTNINPVDFNCCVGDLLYAQLRCKLRFLRMECESEMVRLSVTRQPLVEELPENKPDPNDTCNVQAKYHNLSLTEHRNLTDQVLVAHRHWALAYSLLKDKQDVEAYDLTVTLESLQGAGFLLKLYCDEMKQSKMWQLLYNVAKVAHNMDMMVTAVGEMLVLSESIEQKLLENAKEQLNNPQLLVKVKHRFILNMSLHSLNNMKIPEGFELLRSVEADIRKNNICFTLFLILIGKYQKLPDWEKYQLAFSISPSYHFSFHKAISYLLYLIEEKKWGSFTEACQIQWQLMHVSNLIGEANTLLEQPRKARCYLKTPLALAQKLALPLRTLQLLLQLAWVDLRTGLWEDCAVKLEGLEDLLELCGTPVLYRQTPLSPTFKLSVGTLTEPDFLGHIPGCCCLSCTVPEYRRLVLEAITLRATLCAAIGKINDALQYFKLGKRVLKDLTKLNDDRVRQSCCRLWLCYADTLALTLKYQEALKANSQALPLASAGQDPNIIQFAEEQKFTLQHYMFQHHHSPIGVRIALEADKTPSKCHTPPTMKTPLIFQGKSPLGVVNDNVILPPITPCARPVRPFKLFSSGEENTPPKSTAKPRRQTKIPKYVTKTPCTTATHKSTKPSSSTFIIVDDDGKAVGVSGKKPIAKTKAKPDSASYGSTKKTLFSSHGVSPGFKSELASPTGETGDIMRKSSRRNPARVYGNAKTVIKKDKNPYNPAQESPKNEVKKKDDDDDDVFVFEKMKKVIHGIEDGGLVHSLPENSNSNKISSTLTQASKSLCTINSKTRDAVGKKSNNKDDSDCDIIEGTPPEPTKWHLTSLRPKRATRSNKL